jgi:3-phenylpropionate/trans-cinnamate dioxygenase ferredoxin reductase component
MTEPFALVIVGGGPAGMAAAQGFRDAGGRGAIAIVADEGRMPYRRPPLTKELLRGEAAESDLPLREESWLAANDVRLVAARAVWLDARERVLTLAGERELRYETCVLAPGAEPRRLSVPGADDPGVRVLRTLDHLRELVLRLVAGGTVAVVGSGFIGCEIAASLRHRGHPVSLITDESAPQVARLGEGVAERLRGWLEEAGVAVCAGLPVKAIERDGTRLVVHADGMCVTADLVVMAVGVVPRLELARSAGLETPGGALAVNAAMRTELDGLLAAGDACLAYNDAAGRALRVEHWGDALGQGGVAGRTAAGADAAWREVPGFWSEIGEHTVKQASWGDGHETVTVTDHPGGGFTAWYERGDQLVGVLTHDADEDYERGRDLIARRASAR